MDSVQVAPPSDDLAANGTCWPEAVSAVPTATTSWPRLATWFSTVLVVPAGSGRFTSVQACPSAEVQAEAPAPAEPTATNPCGPAVTASICRLVLGPSSAPGPPVADTASAPRCQPARSADHQAAAIVRPPVTW